MRQHSAGVIATTTGASRTAGADVFMADIGTNDFSCVGSLVESVTDFDSEYFAVFVGIKFSNFDIFNAVSLDLKC